MMRFRHTARAAALLGGILTALHTLDAQPVPRPPARDTVLFICEHGTVRSLIATKLFERYAQRAGLPMTAISRGTAIDSAVPPWLQRALTTDQIELGAFRPTTLGAADLASARFVVSFDLPEATTAGARGTRVRWDGLPSVSANYTVGRDAIDARVRHLVDSLQRARSGPRK